MRMERVGEVLVWWIDRPKGPRLSPRSALLAAAVILPSLMAMMTWVDARGERVWPWTTVTLLVPSPAQYLLRYLYLLAGGFLYVVATSVPAWIHLARTAREDLRAARRAAESADWPSAALHLHRHALLREELRGASRARRAGGSTRSDRAEIAALDGRISPELPAGRRLFLYYSSAPPALPDAPESGFQPRIVPVAMAGGWWTGGVVAVVAVAVLAHLAAALAARDWRALGNVNFLVEAAVLLVYGYVALGGLLGRRRYFRFSPGVAELLRFKLRASATRTESIDLRRCDVFLTTMSSAALLALADHATGRGIAEYELGGGREIVETCLRAVLSAAPQHPLPPDELTA